jgi:Meiotic cell cortex C-terminal pleckstrin homology
MNSATDETISPLDPRRFTPSLHASLVSEILSLRREVESKTKDIEGLEASLHKTRNENESLEETLASTSKESRSLKRQMQLLEGGTVSAMSEWSKERDEAVNDSADLRKRLEQSQKKVRNQEESAERTQMLWDRDRATWEKDKRALETKVHIVEGRLRVVLSEIANSHTVNGQVLHQDTDHHESPKKAHRRKGSAASLRSIGPTVRRRDSEISSGTQEGELNGYRLSTMSLANGISTSLADELAFDEEEEDQMEGVPEEQGSADELPEERPTSVQSRPLDHKARKVLGISPEDQLPILVEKAHQRQSIDTTTKNHMISQIQSLCKVQYVDAGVQYSPPSSPRLSPTGDTQKATDEDEKTIFYADAVSHQESERSMSVTDSAELPATSSQRRSSMISTSCQTTGQLPTPPWTPLTLQIPKPEELSAIALAEVETTSAATQTDPVVDIENLAPTTTATYVKDYPIPVIAIHPPISRPATPTSNVMLPPQTKNASCQVSVQEIVGYTSSSMQTEEIRVDAQTTQLPQKLLPARKPLQQLENGTFRKSPALPPANPLPNSSKRRLQQPGAIKPASSRRKALETPVDRAVRSPTPEAEESTPSTAPESQTRRSESSASYVAPEKQEHGDISESEQKRFDEDDIFSRPTAKFTLRAGKLVSKDEPEPDYQDIFDKIDAEADEPELPPVNHTPAEMPGKPSRTGVRGNTAPTRPLERKPRTLRSTSSKQFDIRKAALISSGAAAHQSSQDPGPSVPVKPPPFPVPTRHSSRKLPISISEGAQSPTPAGRSPRKRDGKSQKPLLRKVRSATSVSRAAVHGRQRTPSPPLLSSQYNASHDPGLPLPPLPYEDSMPPPGLGYATSSRRRPPISRPSHSREDSASTVLQQTSVVDAIAQTMVGEWMYKYVRRRKSFGVPEPKAQDWDLMRNGEELSASITNTGVRHKRWVWLAPYERAVMWSSKQPTSGSALMGKSGRKRMYYPF